MRSLKEEGINPERGIDYPFNVEKEVICRREEYLIDELLDVISPTPYERLTDKRLFQKDGRLMKERIIETCTAGRYIFFFFGRR